MRKSLCLLFLSTALLSGCVTVPNVRQCTVAGMLAAGMDCAETNTGAVSQLSLDETILFLEPNETRAGAVCISAVDRAREKDAMERACRLLGNKCKFEGGRK